MFLSVRLCLSFCPLLTSGMASDPKPGSDHKPQAHRRSTVTSTERARERGIQGKMPVTISDLTRLALSEDERNFGYYRPYHL